MKHSNQPPRSFQSVKQKRCTHDRDDRITYLGCPQPMLRNSVVLNRRSIQISHLNHSSPSNKNVVLTIGTIVLRISVVLNRQSTQTATATIRVRQTRTLYSRSGRSHYVFQLSPTDEALKQPPRLFEYVKQERCAHDRDDRIT